MRRMLQSSLALSMLVFLTGCPCDLFPALCGLNPTQETADDFFQESDDAEEDVDRTDFGLGFEISQETTDNILLNLVDNGGVRIEARIENGITFFEMFDADENSVGFLDATGQPLANPPGTEEAPPADETDDQADADADEDAADEEQDDDVTTTPPADDQGDDADDDQEDDGNDAEVLVEKTYTVSEEQKNTVSIDSDDDCDPLVSLIFSCDFDLPANANVIVEVVASNTASRPRILIGGDSEEVDCDGASNTVTSIFNLENEAGSFFVAVSDAVELSDEYTIKISVFE